MEAQEAVGHPIDWRTFSLEQVNLTPDADPDELWASPASARGLLPLAAAKWTLARRPEAFEGVQRAVFHARHVEKEKIGRPEVLASVLDRAGLDGPAVTEELMSDRTWVQRARADHGEAVELGVFGVPTLMLPGGRPVFVRLTEVTDGARAVEVWDRVRSAAGDPVIHELKSP